MPKINDTVPISSAPEKDYGEWAAKVQLLSCTLQLAIPLWIEELRGRSWEHIESRAKMCSDVVAVHGDNLMFRSKKKGDSAEAFNRLAEGIACLAFCPGGVKIFGNHWEACLDEDVPGRSKFMLTSLCQAVQKALQEPQH